MTNKREKIFVGTGEDAACIAKKKGASRATCSRIRNGKQDFYFTRYHELQRDGNHLPQISENLYTLIEQGIKFIWRDVDACIIQDLKQEVILRILGLQKVPQNPNAIVVWWAKRIALQHRKQFARRRSMFCAFDESILS